MESKDTKTDESTSADKEKTPNVIYFFEGKVGNVLERAKDEIESQVGKVVDKVKSADVLEDIETHVGKAVDKVKGSAVVERAKEGLETFKNVFHHKKDGKGETSKEENSETSNKEKTHHKETHGTSHDIDESTPIDKVKAPNVFHRAKEEIEAVLATINPKEDSAPLEKKDTVAPEKEKDSVPPKEVDNAPPKKEKEGFWESLGKWLENCCSPSKGKRD